VTFVFKILDVPHQVRASFHYNITMLVTIFEVSNIFLMMTYRIEDEFPHLRHRFLLLAKSTWEVETQISLIRTYIIHKSLILSLDLRLCVDSIYAIALQLIF
jgi:hypothetical protein